MPAMLKVRGYVVAYRLLGLYTSTHLCGE